MGRSLKFLKRFLLELVLMAVPFLLLRLGFLWSMDRGTDFRVDSFALSESDGEYVFENSLLTYLVTRAMIAFDLKLGKVSIWIYLGLNVAGFLLFVFKVAVGLSV